MVNKGTNTVVEEEYSEEGPKCPYCGRQYTADEAYYYDEIEYTEEVCDECEKTFAVEVDSTTSWTTSKQEQDQ